MDENRNAAGFNRQTVLNFRYMSEDALSAIAADLALSLPREALLSCRNHFRMREGRDPTVGELRFLDALAAFWLPMPDTFVLKGLEGIANEEDRRTLDDLCRMDSALERHCGALTPFTLSAIMDMAGRYLARSGILPYHANLRCGSPAELAAQCANPPSSALTLEGISAMLAPESPYRSPAARTVMLLFPNGHEPFSHTVSRFFSTHRNQGLVPLAAPGDEGILPHLLNIDDGVAFDATVFADYRPDEGPASLLTLGKNTVLFLAPAHVVPQLFGQGDALAACGRLTGSRRLVIHRGPEVILSLPIDFLCGMRSIQRVRLALQPHNETVGEPAVVANSSKLLGGVTAAGGAESSILALLGALAEKGADFKRVTLTAALEMPPVTKESNCLAAALPSLFDYHRVVAELALPTCNHRQLLREDLNAPRLTVFAAAERGYPRGESFSTAWQAAVASRDFAAMRKLLHA